MKRNYEQPTLKLFILHSADIVRTSPVKDSWTDANPEWGTIGEGV